MSYELKDLTTLKQQETNKTITFNPLMSASEINTSIQNAIANLDKGKTLTFQFSDGTYSLNEALIFSDFEGRGFINIQGNMSEDYNSLHTNQSVILDFSNSDLTYNFIIQSNILTTIRIYNLHVKTKSTVSVNCFYIHNNIAEIKFKGNFIEGNGTSVWATAVHCGESFIVAENNYFSNIRGALVSYTGGHIHSSNNDDYSTQPGYGLFVQKGGLISKTNNTQPDGSVANEYQANGGVIR